MTGRLLAEQSGDPMTLRSELRRLPSKIMLTNGPLVFTKGDHFPVGIH